ncbi:hypothetical protein HanPSC8_Chr01g0018311 [Helianthus annuus]|nr:hypothetical protein HanPSC8_Chr01g0018311 [Helianthus annuus]
MSLKPGDVLIPIAIVSHFSKRDLKNRLLNVGLENSLLTNFNSLIRHENHSNCCVRVSPLMCVKVSYCWLRISRVFLITSTIPPDYSFNASL